MPETKDKHSASTARTRRRAPAGGENRKPPDRTPERPIRKRRASGDLKDRIIKAAADEFKRLGYTCATTAGIASRAGVTEAQLFRYFGSKSNLFRESIFKPLDEHLRRFTDSHIPEAGSVASFRDMTALYVNELGRFIHDNADMITSLVVAQTYEAHAGHGVGAIASLGRYFERGATLMKRRGATRIKVRPELMVRVSFAAVLACGIFRDWIFPTGLADEEEIRNAINVFVLEGVSANS